MKNKYDVKCNADGIFLGIHLTKQENGCTILRRPAQLQTIFDKYIPNGPLPLPTKTATDAYFKNFDTEDSTLCDAEQYRSLIGALLQQVDCRPDIQFKLSK